MDEERRGDPVYGTTGHEYFGDYIHKIKATVSAACVECGHVRDTAHHTLIECI